MTPARKWLMGAGGFVVLLLAIAALAWALVPRNDELARRAAAALSSASGVPVSVGSVHWELLPVPRVVAEAIVTGRPRPVEIKKITFYPRFVALLQRRLQFQRVVLEGATLSQLSLRALTQGFNAERAPTGAPFALDALPVERLEVRDVTWLSRNNIAVVYDGEADFDAGWLPRHGQLRRPGVQPAADLSITRQAQDDRWAVMVRLGGGTANGEVQLQTLDDGRLRLGGTLLPQGIDTAAFMATFNRQPVLAGKASGTTTLSAEAPSLVALIQSLHTRSGLRVSRARLLLFDLDKAVRSAGRDHDGVTALDSLSGQLDTQSTPNGLVIDFSNVKAGSGVLTATGKARLLNQRIDGEFAVDLVKGVVGVPLKISGPVSDVNVSVPAAAVAGAAVGTAVLPGVGTALGARIGATLGKIFSPEAERAPRQKPPTPRGP